MSKEDLERMIAECNDSLANPAMARHWSTILRNMMDYAREWNKRYAVLS